MAFINIGFGNVVNSQKIVAVVSPDAAPVKRMVQSVRGTRSLIDATQGRKTKAVIVTSDDYLVLSALLFFIGVFGFITRRNLIAMLISVELVLNAVDINFAAFNRLLHPDQLEGFFMTLFSVGVSAAEAAVAIAIILNVYHRFNSDKVNSIQNLKY